MSLAPDRVSMTLPGLRSRWIDAGAVRAVERVGDLGAELAARRPPAARRGVRRAASVSPSISSITQVVGVALASDVEQRADVRMVERRDGPRLALEAGAHLGVGRQVLGQHLDRDVAPEARVARAVHLAHAAGAERGDDLVGSEPGPGGQCHPRNLHQAREQRPRRRHPAKWLRTRGYGSSP